MTFPQIKNRPYDATVPIIQGGMGVEISLSGLSSAVANTGGIGTISGTGITVDEMRSFW